MSIEHLCQVKTAILLTYADHRNILDYMEDHDDRLPEMDLPRNWEIKGTGIAGASGFVILFETEDVPEQWEFFSLARAVDQAELALTIKCNLKKVNEKGVKE